MGETDVPDRKNYDVSEPGLSVQAARNLFTQKVNPQVVNYLLESSEAADTAKHLQTLVYQADQAAIQKSFMKAVQVVKKEVGQHLSASRELTSQAVREIFAKLTKGQHKPNRKITAEQIGEAVSQSVAHLPGVDPDVVKQMFLAMTGMITGHETGEHDQ